MSTPAGNEPTGISPGGATYLLTLYVAGPTMRSQQAAAALRRICVPLGTACDLTIVDVLERPELAEEQKILATPTVVRHWPLPARRVIGDLDNLDKVILGLDLPPLAVDTQAEATL